jgi:hypothetical protein
MTIVNEQDKEKLQSYSDGIHKAYLSISDDLAMRVNKIAELDDMEAAQTEIKKLLMILSDHTAALLASICFDLVQDPENWLKHTFYQSLKHVQYRRKELLDAAIDNDTKH